MIIDGTNKPAGSAEKDPLLVGLGQRVKLLRARRGIPRRVLAEAADVSERHLANLESGIGNVSVLVLQQVAQALGCSPGRIARRRDDQHAGMADDPQAVAGP